MKLLAKSRTRFVTALAMASTMLLPVSANGADMLENGAPEYTKVEFGTGWYLRADIGYGMSDTEIESSPLPGSASPELGDPISVGLAAGYMGFEGVRFEAALNHFNQLKVDEQIDIGCDPAVVLPAGCSTDFSRNVNVSNFMVNAYLDLPKVAGFTPYIGAGAGAAYVTWNQLDSRDPCLGAGLPSCPSATQSQAESTVAPAANLMVGGAVDVTDNLKLDVGYRYTLIDSTDVGDVPNSVGDMNNIEATMTDIHEVRIGMRYEIW